MKSFDHPYSTPQGSAFYYHYHLTLNQIWLLSEKSQRSQNYFRGWRNECWIDQRFSSTRESDLMWHQRMSKVWNVFMTSKTITFWLSSFLSSFLYRTFVGIWSLYQNVSAKVRWCCWERKLYWIERFESWNLNSFQACTFFSGPKFERIVLWDTHWYSHY